MRQQQYTIFLVIPLTACCEPDGQWPILKHNNSARHVRVRSGLVIL